MPIAIAAVFFLLLIFCLPFSYSFCQFKSLEVLGIRLSLFPGEDFSGPSVCRPQFRYHVVDTYGVDQEGSALSLIFDNFPDLVSLSQVRKACRHGEFFALQENILNARTMVFTDLFPLLRPLEPGSRVFGNNTIVRVSRDPQLNCFSVDQTGYVWPPEISTSMPAVVYEDDQIAVVKKPEGLDTIGSPRLRNDLQSLLPFFLKPPPNTTSCYLPRPIHRLDRRTSGLVLVAKSSATMRTMSEAFRTRKGVQKVYAALVFGVIQRKSGTIDYPIDGKNAVSRWRVLDKSHNTTLLQIEPLTGRTHQIRRHLSYCLGTPIIGDNKYDGGKFKEFRQYGLFLCSKGISFQHPATRVKEEFSIDLPSKFLEMLERGRAP